MILAQTLSGEAGVIARNTVTKHVLSLWKDNLEALAAKSPPDGNTLPIGDNGTLVMDPQGSARSC